jgi:tRNA-dihydrouridine synthase
MAQREALNHPGILYEIDEYARRPNGRRDGLNPLIEKIQPLLNGVVVDNIKNKLKCKISYKKRKLIKERQQYQANNIRQQTAQIQNQQEMSFESTGTIISVNKLEVKI